MPSCSSFSTPSLHDALPILGDFLAAVSNVYAGVEYASPGAVAIENEVIDWLKKVFGFPETAVGNLASGGSISNMIALTAARDKRSEEHTSELQSRGHLVCRLAPPSLLLPYTTLFRS